MAFPPPCVLDAVGRGSVRCRGGLLVGVTGGRQVSEEVRSVGDSLAVEPGIELVQDVLSGVQAFRRPPRTPGRHPRAGRTRAIRPAAGPASPGHHQVRAAGRSTSGRWPRRTARAPIPRSPPGRPAPAPRPPGPAPRPGRRHGAATCTPRWRPAGRALRTARTRPGGRRIPAGPRGRHRSPGNPLPASSGRSRPAARIRTRLPRPAWPGGRRARTASSRPATRIGGHADRPYAARQGSRGRPEPRSRHHVTMCTRSLLSHLADKRSIPPIPRRWQPCRTQSGWHADVLFGVLPLRLPHGREGGCDVAALAGRGGSDGAAGAIGRDVDAAAGALIRMWSTDCRGCGRVLGRDGARRRPERLGRRCLPVQRGLSPAGAGSRAQRGRGGGSRARRGTWQVTRNRDGKTPAALGPGDRVCPSRLDWAG